MLKKSPFLLLAVAVFFCTTVSAQETMMQDVSQTYLQKLVDTAKKYYPRMRLQQKRVENAEADLKKAKLGWLDAASFSYLYSPNNTTTLVNPSFLNGYQVGLVLNVGTLLQKPYNIKHAKGDLAITKAEQDEYNLNITAMVKQRYYLYVQSKILLQIKMQAIMEVEGTVQQVKYRFEKGEESLENYNKYMMTYDDRLQAKIEAEASMLIAKSNLEELLGINLEQVQ